MLKAFIVEMVAGMAHERARGSSTGLGDTNAHRMWLHELKEDLPGFRIYCWYMQSSDYVPQHRLRLYTVGI